MASRRPSALEVGVHHGADVHELAGAAEPAHDLLGVGARVGRRGPIGQQDGQQPLGADGLRHEVGDERGVDAAGEAEERLLEAGLAQLGADELADDAARGVRVDGQLRRQLEGRLAQRVPSRPILLMPRLLEAIAHDLIELAQDELRPLVAQQRGGDALAAHVGGVDADDEEALVVGGRREDRVTGGRDDLAAAPEGDRLVHADAVDEDDEARGQLRVGRGSASARRSPCRGRTR